MPRSRAAWACACSRGSRKAASCEAVSPEEARAFLQAGLGAQVSWYDASIRLALAALCAKGAWRLDLSGDPQEALAYLERVLADVAGGL